MTNVAGLGAKAIGDESGAGRAKLTAPKSVPDVVLAVPSAFGDCTIDVLLFGSSWPRSGFGADSGLRRNGVLAAPSKSASGTEVRVRFGVSNCGAKSMVGNSIDVADASPALCTTPVREPGAADEPAGDESSVAADETDGGLNGDDTLGGRFGERLSSGDEVGEPGAPEEGEPDDELESDGSASATPGMAATAEPTPSATANAPTRPT